MPTYRPRRPIVSHSYELRRLRVMADEVGDGSILDIGYAQQPSPYLEGDEVVGIDLQSIQPAAAPNYTERLIGDATDIAATTGPRRFDNVVCGELIEHVENPYAFLRQLRPVLHANGRLVLSTPNPLGFPVCIAEAMRSRRFFFSGDHLYLFAPRWVERMLTRAGFELLSTRPVGLWLPWGHLPWSPVGLSYIVVYVARPQDPTRSR